jgi:hypothetical protein
MHVAENCQNSSLSKSRSVGKSCPAAWSWCVEAAGLRPLAPAGCLRQPQRAAEVLLMALHKQPCLL